MRHFSGRALASVGSALLVLGLLFVAGASAQQTMRVRGIIAKVDGDAYLIKSRDGEELALKLAPNPGISATVKATIADIKPGAYIGVAALPQPDGTLLAISVHIFAESMRGLAEGHRPWDLQPQSSMTNATVESSVSSVSGQAVVLRYKDGEQKVIIPSALQIVAYVPGEVADLKPGAGIFIGAALKREDGTLTAQRVTVGRDVAPPM